MFFEIELVERPLLCLILQNGYSRLPREKMIHMFANLFLIEVFKKNVGIVCIQNNSITLLLVIMAVIITFCFLAL